jgi:hypothetical protein
MNEDTRPSCARANLASNNQPANRALDISSVVLGARPAHWNSRPQPQRLP